MKGGFPVNRREFLKLGSMGALTVFLSGCGLASLAGGETTKAAVPEQGTVSGGKKGQCKMLWDTLAW